LSKNVDTSYGRTFVLCAGKEGNPPVVVLHGSCSNSAFMTPELFALSQNYRAYAADIVGEAGNSDGQRPPLDTDAYAVWLRDVLDALGHARAAVVGNSLGGWIALKFATAYPGRVTKLALIAPGGLAGQYPELLEKARSAGAQNETLAVESSVAGGEALPKEVADFINLILRVYDPITQELPVFTDEALSRLKMPVLLVAGRRDNLLDAAGAAERVERLLPHPEVHLLENEGHMILRGPEFLLPFLDKDSAT
jgi:pimeloyl-ACP methyl ester carboxylesterase